jgi:hypothetical protein
VLPELFAGRRRAPSSPTASSIVVSLQNARDLMLVSQPARCTGDLPVVVCQQSTPVLYSIPWGGT